MDRLTDCPRKDLLPGYAFSDATLLWLLENTPLEFLVHPEQKKRIEELLKEKQND